LPPPSYFLFSVYALSGLRYERVGGHGIVHAAYAFEVGPEVVADFLRAFGNKAKLVLRGKPKFQAMVMDFVQSHYGLRPDAGALMAVYVDFVGGEANPLRIRFSREPPDGLGRAVGRAEAKLKFGEYAVLAVVDGVKYVGFDATVDGFRRLEVAEKYLRRLYPFYASHLEELERDYWIFAEELEDARKLAEGVVTA